MDEPIYENHLGEGSRFLKNTAWLVYYLIIFTVGYTNANILRTVAAMKKVNLIISTLKELYNIN